MPIRNISLLPNLPFNVLPIQDITDTLATRLPDPETPRTPDKITHIAVHHSAVEGGTIAGYADYHVNSLKWSHIGYHTVIKGNQIFQTNDLLTFSYHTSSNNSYTVSVSVSGDLSKRALTTDERNCLYATILTLMNIFKIPAENVLGHNEYPSNNTACPCIDMNQLRSDIKNIQMKMQQQDSWESKLTKISQMVNQFNYFNSLVKGGAADGNAVWAVSQQMQLYDVMKDKGYV
ncbi:peptidoglycan recognition protein family protein [Paenibacillus alba]|uniref:Peptidoglycan recognition protein family domain-containing protein n=1 Tax=Paenibacillus alba TaxID=1197127 RepID=A0ABU6GAM1_9BACL|nr:N-acetylmuramoyl-L-alanine amidase [Paenibacillus alba]MEC0231191.1 hypothetical protein [Paenibacillus alba]